MSPNVNNVVKVLLVSVALYATSTSLILYNKWLANVCESDYAAPDEHPKTFVQPKRGCPGYGFPFPLFVACVQFALHILFGAVLVHVLKVVPYPNLSRRELIAIHVQGACVGIYVGLANLSFLFLHATFFEELRQLATVFTLVLTYVFGLDVPDWRVILAIIMVSGGVGLAVAGEGHLSGQEWGIVWVIASCVVTAMSNVLVQYLVQPPPPLKLEKEKAGGLAHDEDEEVTLPELTQVTFGVTDQVAETNTSSSTVVTTANDTHGGGNKRGLQAVPLVSANMYDSSSSTSEGIPDEAAAIAAARLAAAAAALNPKPETESNHDEPVDLDLVDAMNAELNELEERKDNDSLREHPLSVIRKGSTSQTRPPIRHTPVPEDEDEDDDLATGSDSSQSKANATRSARSNSRDNAGVAPSKLIAKTKLKPKRVQATASELSPLTQSGASETKFADNDDVLELVHTKNSKSVISTEPSDRVAAISGSATKSGLGGSSSNSSSSSLGSHSKAIHPIILLYLHSYASCLVLIPLAGGLEMGHIHDLWKRSSGTFITSTLLIILLGAVLAFFLQWSSYVLTQVTSAVSYCVISTCKTVIVIVAGVIMFRNHMTPLNIFGFAICFLGLLLYGYLKALKKQSNVTSDTSDSNSSINIDESTELVESGSTSPSKALSVNA